LQYLPFNGWNAVSELLLSDNDPDNDLTPLGCQRVFMYETRKRQRNELADYEIDGGFGGPVPLVSEILGNLRFYTSYRRDRDVLLWPAARPDYVDYDWMLRLTSDIAPSMKLRLSALTGNISTLADNGWSDRFYPHWPNEIADGTGGRTEFNMFSDWAWSLADIKHRSLAAKFTHTLSPSTFYEISLDYFQRQYYTRPTALRDTSKVYEILPGYFVDEYPLGYWPTELVGVTPNIADGIQASLARDFSKVSSATLKADLTSQINFSNLIKAGVEFIYNDLNMDYGYIQMQTQGKTYGRQVQMHNFPVRAAAYIQDKLETEGFTMNAGLRLDYSDSKMEWWDVDFYNPYFISSKYNEDRVFAMKESKAQWQLSPRLGISHPITENSKLFFNYGHFKQMPQYETLFKIDRNANNELNRIGDPSLTLAKTISYELGYDHILSNDFLVQVAAFYRDISNQQDTTRYWSINSGDYYLTTSNNYEDIRGFEVTLRKTAGRWFSGFANYTYQVTTRGNFGSPERFEDPSSQKEYDEETVHIYQERITPAPYARTNLNFYTPDDFGPVLAGHHVLGGFMLNFLLSWSQGGWTTYNPKSASGEVNNVQFVDKYDGMLQASKTISFKHFRVQLLVDIANLFNRLELSDTDNQQYRQSLHLPRNKAYDNIPGEDKFGDYRKPGVEWQPIEYRAEVQGTTPTEDDITIYYEGKTGIYWQSVNGQWTMVDSRRMYQILEDKAYIFNPGPSTWYFLNPRKITFGIRVSFDLN
jgi:outer membrane receptor protein involved in Fe transport